eukprot:6206731-Pleurochrysis_carterae.AAC.2
MQISFDSPPYGSLAKALQQSTVVEGYVGYPPRPNRMYPICSYVFHGAGCHDNGDHDSDGSPRRHVKE